MNDHHDFFVSSTSTTASTVAAHPLQVLIMRQCAASNQDSENCTWKTGNNTLHHSPQSYPSAGGDWTPESNLSLLTNTCLPDATRGPVQPNDLFASSDASHPVYPHDDEGVDPLASVSRKIMDLMCDVDPELPSKLPTFDGQSGDAALQQRISNLIRQQLNPPDDTVSRVDPRSGYSTAYDNIRSLTPNMSVPYGTNTHLREPRRYLRSYDARDPTNIDQQQARDTSSAPETINLAHELAWVPHIQYGGTTTGDKIQSFNKTAIIGDNGGALQHRGELDLLQSYSNASIELHNATKDESYATTNEQSRQKPSPPEWWRDPQPSSQHYGRDYRPSKTPLNSEASPCTSTTAGMSDEGLSTIMAEFVLQEFLRSQAGGNGSMSPSDQDCSPKSNQSLTLTSYTSQGSPVFRDYVASPLHSASSGRNERTTSDLTYMSANKLNKTHQKVAASALLSHDLRLGVYARNVDRESILTSPSNQSQSSLNFNPRPYVPRTTSQRRATLLGAEPLLPRSPPPPTRARQVPRRSVELTHSQAMLAMAAAARRNNCAYSDDHDRMIYISWIPKQSRAYTTMDRRRMELELKRKLREEMHLEGVTKVLLFPPKGAHCKLIFDKRASAEKFMEKYGGDDGSEESERWKHDICTAFGIIVNERFAKTVVKIEWSQK